MNRFGFWQRWLFVVSCVLVFFGVLLAFFGQSPLFDVAFNNQINPVFWGTFSLSADIKTFQAWAYGILGATVAGWGIFLAFIVYYPFKRKEKWAWNCIAIGMPLWFVIDTGLSLTYHVYFNAAFNTILLILIALPLVFSRAAFVAGRLNLPDKAGR